MLNRTVEKFYRAKDGKIVFNASSSIGAKLAFPCSHIHGYKDNGFPKTSPVNIDGENIWSAFAGMSQNNEAC